MSGQPYVADLLPWGAMPTPWRRAQRDPLADRPEHKGYPDLTRAERARLRRRGQKVDVAIHYDHGTGQTFVPGPGFGGAGAGAAIGMNRAAIAAAEVEAIRQREAQAIEDSRRRGWRP